MQLEKRLNSEYFANMETFYSSVEEYALVNACTLGIE